MKVSVVVILAVFAVGAWWRLGARHGQGAQATKESRRDGTPAFAQDRTGTHAQKDFTASDRFPNVAEVEGDSMLNPGLVRLDNAGREDLFAVLESHRLTMATIERMQADLEERVVRAKIQRGEYEMTAQENGPKLLPQDRILAVRNLRGHSPIAIHITTAEIPEYDTLERASNDTRVACVNDVHAFFERQAQH